MRNRIKRLISRHRRNRAVAKAASLCRTFFRAFENLDYDAATNGEERVLRVLGADGGPRVIFDVGANVGSWTELAAMLCPRATVYSFEAIPSTFGALKDRCASLPAAKPSQLALGDKAGFQEFFYCAHRSDLASAVPGVHGGDLNTQRVTVPVATGDEFCAEHNVPHIDFLKVDVEGWEQRVLSGFEGMLKRRAVTVLQLEYNIVNIRTRFLLADLYTLLGAHGFSIGKIYPTYVDFRPYAYDHEDFAGPNYLAVLSDEKQLIARLSAESV